MTLSTVNHQSKGSLEVYVYISEMCPLLWASLGHFLKGVSTHAGSTSVWRLMNIPSVGRCYLSTYYVAVDLMHARRSASKDIRGMQLPSRKTHMRDTSARATANLPDVWPGKPWEGGHPWTHLSRKSSSSSLSILYGGAWWPGDLGRIWCFQGSKEAEEGMGKLCFKSSLNHLAWKRSCGQTLMDPGPDRGVRFL